MPPTQGGTRVSQGLDFAFYRPTLFLMSAWSTLARSSIELVCSASHSGAGRPAKSDSRQNGLDSWIKDLKQEYFNI